MIQVFAILGFSIVVGLNVLWFDLISYFQIDKCLISITNYL